MRKLLRNNGLSIVLLGLFLIFLGGQSIAGYLEHNETQREHGQPELSFIEYVGDSHFLEATAENWESEFLQMSAYVLLTAFLFQKGSSESKDPGRLEPVDVIPADPKFKADAPWPVRKGGWILKVYENSLSLAFFLLFAVSFFLHALGGVRDHNSDQLIHGQPGNMSVLEYMASSRFWFESFQNWQSEFLAIGSMVVLSIFLRQKGSAESKPVDSSYSETGR